VVAIVALDDALAMTLYGLGTSAAQMLTSGGADFFDEMKKVVIELGGAMLLGAVCAVILMAVLRWIKETERNLAFAIGIILLAISLSIYANMDVILATMTFGFVLINIAPRRSEELFSLMRSFSIPIYVLFFVFVGARLGISDMPKWLWGIVAIYVVGRSAGKMLGAYIGARITGADTAVKKYMGLSLFAQGGVAVGLSIMASHHLGKIPLSGELTLGDAIIFAVTATTLIVQFIGPAMVKLAIKLAGESGKNITEDDIVEEKKVKDLMDVTRDMIFESDSLQDAVSKFVEHDCIAYPVVDKEGRNVGMVSLDSFKEVLDERSSWEWILVADVMKPSDEKVGMFSPLKDALDLMKQLHLELLPVVDEDSGSLSGMLLMGNVKKRISGELLKRQSN
jgi:CBS domain-containing protein